MGVERAVDCSANDQARATAIRATRKWGRIVFLGEGGRVEFNPSPDIIHDQKTIYGSWVTSTWLMEELVERLVRWNLHPADLVTHRFALDNVDQAYTLMASGKCGKVAVCFDEELLYQDEPAPSRGLHLEFAPLGNPLTMALGHRYSYRTPRVCRPGTEHVPHQHIPHAVGACCRCVIVEQAVALKRHPLLNPLLVLHGKEGVESFRGCQTPHAIVHGMRPNPVIGEHAVVRGSPAWRDNRHRPRL
jgi:hypothetical protein